jgi:aryl-alcohol dehydrogenase
MTSATRPQLEPRISSFRQNGMRTDALVLSEPGGKFKYKKITLRDNLLEPDECLVRIKATGICHTDLNFASKDRGQPENFPCVLGHEGAGTVIKVGSWVEDIAVGDEVIVTFTSCAQCRNCETGFPGYCDRWFKYNLGFSRFDGTQTIEDPKSKKPLKGHFFGQSSFAREIIVCETALVVIPAPVPAYELLAPLACGVMTGAGAMLNIVKPQPHQSVCVLGVGSVGLSAIMALKTLARPPRRIIALDILSSRLELAKKYGATHGINTTYQKDLMPTLMEITKGAGVDATIDCVGLPKVVEQIVHGTARRGRIVAVGVGVLSNAVSINTFEAVQAGLVYQGSLQGDSDPKKFLPWLLKMNQEGKFPYDELITTYHVEEVAEAIKDVKVGRTVKAVLLWDTH